MSICVNTVCNDFYLTEQADQVVGLEEGFLPSRILFQKQVKSIKERVHKRSAKLFAEYLFFAIAGELRYTWSQSNYLNPSKLNEFGIARGAPAHAISREEAQNRVIIKRKRSLLTLAIKIFYKAEWNKSYGGNSWGKIAKVLQKYLRKEWNDTIFCDQVFDLRHNGGILFDKRASLLFAFESALVLQLRKKKYSLSMTELYSGMIEYHKRIDKQVLSILEKGERLGYWSLGEAQVEKKKITIKKEEVKNVKKDESIWGGDTGENFWEGDFSSATLGKTRVYA